MNRSSVQVDYCAVELYCESHEDPRGEYRGPVDDDESLDEVGVDVDALVPHIEEEEEVFGVVEDERLGLQEWDETVDDF